MIPLNTPLATASRVATDRPAPSAYRIIDWTRLDGAPPPADVERLLQNVARDGSARLAVLVSTPRALRAATVFADQAALQGAQVRVFVGAMEAAAWLYRDLPAGNFHHDWPVDSTPHANPFR